MRSPIEEASALAGMLRAASIRSAARDLLVRFELILALALAALAVWMTSVLALPHLAAACPVIRFVGIAAFCAALAASAWRAAAGRVPERSLAALWERA
ncbi:MAG: hypothetical protein N3A38_10235, partial [Planctomycetota bacterium]|nr:hypothetical protein [Planctomycetota bacterium]